jgi:hypothetical protein
VPNMVERNLIRWNGDNPGSLIWAAAKQNQHLVTNHTFWEVRNGKMMQGRATQARPYTGASSSQPEELEGYSISLSADLHPQKSVLRSPLYHREIH